MCDSNPDGLVVIDRLKALNGLETLNGLEAFDNLKLLESRKVLTVSICVKLLDVLFSKFLRVTKY